MRFWFLIPIILLIIPSVKGQKESEDLSNYFLLGLDYGSNTSTFGVSLSDVKQPNYILTCSYLSKYNFDLTYAGVLTDNADSSYSKPAYEHNLALGYLFDLSEKFMVYPSYTHLIHSENSYALKSVFNNIAQIDALFYSKYYNASLSISHLWGTKNMFYITLQNALEISIKNFLHKDGLLNIQIGASINYSDNNFYNKLLFDDFNSEELLGWLSYKISLTQLNTIQRLIEQNGIELVKQYIYENNRDSFDPDYRITTIDFYLPLYYSINNLMLSATAFVTIPTATSEFYDQYTSFQFMGGISYFFEL